MVGKVSPVEMTFEFGSTSVEATVGLNVTVHEVVELIALVGVPEGHADISLVFQLPTDSADVLLVDDVKVVVLDIGASINSKSVAVSALQWGVDPTGNTTVTASLGVVENNHDGVDDDADVLQVALQFRIRDYAEIVHGKVIVFGFWESACSCSVKDAHTNRSHGWLLR